MPKKINIRGIIGRDTTPENIEQGLKEANGGPVVFSISSPGGLITPGIEIHNMIKRYSGKTHVHVASLAGSMASIIMFAGKDKPTVEKNSIFFMHNAQGVALGDHNIMFKMGNMLESLSNMFAREYVQASKKSLKEVKQMMDDETDIVGGEEIVKHGFAGSVLGDEATDPDADAMAKLEIDECLKFVKSHEMSEAELDRAITLCKTDYQQAVPENNTPALGAGKSNNQEVPPMTMEELKLQHPALYNAIFDAGKQAGKNEMLAMNKRVAVFLDPQSVYKDKVKGIAVSVIKGEKSLESLEMVVDAIDAMTEAIKSDDAKNETEKLGDTKAEQDTQGKPTKDGVITSEADYQSELRRSKALDGMEVK